MFYLIPSTMKLKWEGDWSWLILLPLRSLSQAIKKSKEFSSALALVDQSEGSVTCTFCKQGHPSVSCGVVTDIKARRNLLKWEGRCFIWQGIALRARNGTFAQEDITCQFARKPTAVVSSWKVLLKEGT